MQYNHLRVYTNSFSMLTNNSRNTICEDHYVCTNYNYNKDTKENSCCKNKGTSFYRFFNDE